LWWYKNWLDRRNLHEKAQLIMHTDPTDVHGQDLNAIVKQLGLDKRQALFSTEKISAEKLAIIYNMADVTINISDAEGFGLATLESLSCGTPIIVTMTGGLQEQVVGNGDVFGVPLFPTSKAIIGSQSVPYIYEDRICEKDFLAALDKIYDMGQTARLELGLRGREYVMQNYNFANFNKSWIELVTKIHETEGSWETRTIYNGIRFKEIA